MREFIVAILVAGTLFTGSVAQADHKTYGYKFRIIYTSAEGSKTRTNWSDCVSSVPTVYPPRVGSVVVKVRRCFF